jgi:hypothetical protein
LPKNKGKKEEREARRQRWGILEDSCQSKVLFIKLELRKFPLD